MINYSYDSFEDDLNPIDFIEEYANHKSWYNKRIDPHTIKLQMAGQRSKYDIVLHWNDEFYALTIDSFIECTIPKNSFDMLADFLMQANNDVLYGHFSLDIRQKKPVFRYALMLEHLPSSVAVEMAAQAVEIAIAECDSKYATFEMLSNGSIDTHETLSTALMETIGEA